jgi:transcriptional regulator with PAS, ATPase and Fis domain
VQAIHTASVRHLGPFVTVNCGAFNDELLGAELFGYVEGAFTGAVKGGRKGKVELAHGGSLFLDEVEAMSAKMQVSLLRVLEERRLTRVGGEQPVSLDIRVIAASNEDLRTAVEQKRFRTDLYHRLCIFPIHLPPLRERMDDLPLLAGWPDARQGLTPLPTLGPRSRVALSSGLALSISSPPPRRGGHQGLAARRLIYDHASSS